MNNIKFTKIAESDNSCFVILINKKLENDNEKSRELDKKVGGAITDLLAKGNFKGEIGESKVLYTNIDGKWHYIMLVGIGENSEIDQLAANIIGASIFKACKGAKLDKISIIINHSLNFKLSEPEYAANIALGLLLKSYKFDKYFTKNDNNFDLGDIEIIIQNSEEANTTFKSLIPIYNATKLIKDLVSEPSNKLFPKSYAEICNDELSVLGVKVTILDKHQMSNLGMEALLGVAKGSANDPQMVIMEYYGTDKESQPLAFIGKGVTFDSGGISLKPALNMEAMKYDMAGSAAVVGAIHILATRKAKINAIGIIGLVENMPDGNAQKPGDIVKSMSGQTIEVLNTDAEGRLVLSDLLWYSQEKFKPKVIIDLATLTGAIVISLGNVYAGLFCNNDKLVEQLQSSGTKVGENLWRLPLHKDYDKMMNSKIADMQNISNAKGAGSITAAQFLQRFIKDGTSWAHIDIAGVAWADKEKALDNVGATAFGVKLLNQFVQDFYEK